ncbi:carboxylating nicotinate-nucleotide diphosphorylase [bacterium]|nr:carboxylating nicotinate-nucleotide diphosphorylase [bacterium]
MQISDQEIQRAVQQALVEDVGSGDATTASVIPSESFAVAEMRAREDLTLSGIDFARITFELVDEELEVTVPHSDGQRIETGDCLLRIQGHAAAILTAERTALNFIQRLSGVATFTQKYVDHIAHTNAKVLDTRKTTPGWRHFEKYAVACGGGTNHRLGLFDQIMIKDNHLATLGPDFAQTIPLALKKARAMYPALKIEIEADTLEQASIAMDAGADIILLDNMPPETLAKAVEANNGRCLLEASGGVTLDAIAKIAETGVDFISVGALTHSAPAVDIALDFQLPTL